MIYSFPISLLLLTKGTEDNFGKTEKRKEQNRIDDLLGSGKGEKFRIALFEQLGSTNKERKNAPLLYYFLVV